MTEARTASQNTPVVEGAWTTRRLLAWVSDAFGRKGLDSPKLSAEILLAHVLKAERLKLYMEPDREASKEELSALRGLVGRALKDEPVQYLTGEGWFFGLPLAVDRRVLVPRPCTEVMVETVLQRCRTAVDVGGAAGRASGEGVRILDLCTGSGCVAVALAKQLKGAAVVATDVSGDALTVARANAGRHGITGSVDFRQGDLFAALDGVTPGFDFIVSNPPYIPDSEWDDVPANVKLHEPTIALRGGADGLDLVRPIIERAADWLKPGTGVLMVETAAATAQAALKIAEECDRYADGKVVRDLEGLERFVLLTAR